MPRATRSDGRWHVLVDDPAWYSPRRVSRHGSRDAARAEARRLNALDPHGPLHFVELMETRGVLDTGHSGLHGD